MATATLQKEKTGSWSSIFPTSQITETQSALFVKKLLAVSISNVAYLRAIFPEHAFGDRCLEDLNLKILRDDSSCPGACKVIQWVKGCFDALDKKYLRLLVIGIYVDPEDPETVIESYTFKFSYAETGGIDIYRNDKKISSAYSAAETKKATIRLLRTIVVLTQTLKSLPDDIMMTMKLMYYDEVTPPDYEPPGFKAADSDGFVFDEEPMNIKVGDVSTQFHTVKMRIKTDGKQFEMKEEEDTTSNKAEINDTGLEEVATEADSQMDFVQSNKKEEVSRFEVKQHQNQDTKEADVDIPEESPAKPEGKRQEKIETALSERSDCQDEFGVRCPCGCNEDDGLMILCAVCKFWQHGVCFQILDEDVAPVEHICDVCNQPGVAGKEPTDHSLVGMTPITVQATCLWRRALLASLELNRVLAPHLARRLGVEATVAQGLINRLEKEGYVRNAGKGKRLGKLVDKVKIRNEGLPKYLSRKLNPSQIGRDMDTNDTQVTDSQMSQKQPVPNSKRDTQQDVDCLVAQTESINISGNKNRSSERNKKASTNMEGVESSQYNSSERGKKRIHSKVNEAQDFEICGSQDQDSFEPTHRRRRKSSIVTKAIMV